MREMEMQQRRGLYNFRLRLGAAQMPHEQDIIEMLLRSYEKVSVQNAALFEVARSGSLRDWEMRFLELCRDDQFRVPIANDVSELRAHIHRILSGEEAFDLYGSASSGDKPIQ